MYDKIPKQKETKMKNLIPDDFRKSEVPKVETVGELIEQLERLPKDLKTYQGFNDGVKVSVVQMGFTETFRLTFDEYEGDDE
tara:strand:- start:119 stop:364 length:246 start_codon:yes stop_codon:yes gene_type:complete